jgi:hypothetical protein
MMRLDRSGGGMAAARLPNLIHNAADFGQFMIRASAGSLVRENR